MRIVYDDTMQDVVVELVKEFMRQINYNMTPFVRYEWGMDRVQMHKIKPKLNLFISDDGFEIGNTVTHAHGIGNNCMYPVYYNAGNEIQHCANININSGMYGEGYISLEDYNGKKIGMSYEVRKSGVTFKR